MNYSRSKSVLRLKQAGCTAVICGSFKRDPEALRRDFLALKAADCAVLSPVDVEFVGEVDGFVFGKADLGKSTEAVEKLHLAAMQEADLVWLHCPKGYVGSSAAMELGFAHAIGLRVFATERPADVTLADMVTTCASPRSAVETVKADLGDAPSSGLPALQSYYARAAGRRGWAQETPERTLELLRGEIEELEEALAEPRAEDEARLELADVQLYVTHLANALGIDIGEAVRDKEKINAARFEAERVAA